MKKALNFSSRVRGIVSRIPKGRVATYGQVAELASSPRAGRAVGMVMRSNKNRKAVPCHRVVASDGALTGYAFGKGISTKMSMLKKEGVQFAGNRVDLTHSGWSGTYTA